MSARGGQTLKGRITILAVVTCAFLATAAISLLQSVRASHAATENAARQHLLQLVSALADSYTAQAQHGTSLQGMKVQPLPAAPHLNADTTPGPPMAPTPKPPPPPPPPGGNDPLARLTARVLTREDGIEGGFYTPSGLLVGHARAGEQPAAPPPPVPPRERSVLEALTHQAVSSGSVQTTSIEEPHDVVLLAAKPLSEKDGNAAHITGAAWLIQRLPDVNRGRSRQLLFTSLGFVISAVVTALLAWVVIAEVRSGMAAVTRRLAEVQRDLDQPPPAQAGSSLAEFQGLLGGIDAMASALRARIRAEQALEEQLRHRERLASLGQFAAGIAHELRNPLATIRLRTEMWEHATAHDATPANAATPGGAARNSTVILEEIDRLNAMIGRLLHFASPIALDRQPMDLSDLCLAVQQAWSARVPADVVLTSNVPSGITLSADRDRLHQVLDNLIQNAVEASQPGGGTVEMEAETHDGSVTLAVLDRGSGLDATALKHALDPFFTTRAAGTGLGLSIAFEIVKAHGGALLLQPRPGGGAIVSVTLATMASTDDGTA